MKRNFILAIIFAFITCICVGCDTPGNPTPPKTFGYFSYNGKYLTSFASNEINAADAKTLIQSKNIQASPLSTESGALFSVGSALSPDAPKPSSTLVNTVLSKYASVNVVTKYYESGKEAQQSKVDFIQGTDFKNVLEENELTPFSQLVAKGIVMYDTLIDYMEEQNEIYKTSPLAIVAPFTTIFSYHTNNAGNIVIQTRDFAEIPSSVGGGIGCSYRQDTEMAYDNENKLVKWQTSLGVYSATPNGTMMQGYILEVELIWDEKI
ncbi:MAG: hypothetical protein IKC64_02425 [Clostridia bacterium]|nr:hypothetical protein [Clostridia bacterium]